MVRILPFFATYKLLVFAFAFLAIGASVGIWPNSPGHFISLLVEWDAKHILRVASQGYLAEPPTIQILPGFVAGIRLFHLALPNWDLAAFVAAQVFSFFSFYYLYKLAEFEFGMRKDLAQLALCCFAIFPTAYFLTVPYMETLFCAASFATVYYTRRRNFVAAPIMGFIAGSTRIFGVFLAPAIFAHFLFSRKERYRGHLVTAAATALGFFAYLAINKYYFGQWFYFTENLPRYWGTKLSYPFSGLVGAIRSWPTRTPADRMTVVFLEIAGTGMALLTLGWLFLKRRMLDFVYVGLSVALLLCQNFWLSRPRYILGFYPMFLMVAPWIARSYSRLMLYALVSAGLFGMYFALYLGAKWAF